MNQSYLKTPVVLIIFNRPDSTEKVFATIRQAKPQKLFVISDAPRPDKPGEAEKCAATRALIEGVDWDCEVFTNYSDVNLGCGKRISTGISWVFDQVEEAIILEDDCLPHPTFFRYCEELLDKYRDELRVMSICGIAVEKSTRDFSYYFSHYFNCWGWATWRRAWYHYDYQMKHWPEILETGWLDEFLQDRQIVQDWTRRFNKAYHGLSSSYTWSYQLQFACWRQNALVIRSNSNLISNLGYGIGAAHTNNPKDKLANLSLEPISFPLKHPTEITRDLQADDLIKKSMVRDYKRSKNLLIRGYRKIRKILNIN
ncbi:MAG: glycosyltransferase family 2 protein [Symploca sp. SIO2D2]|nr:glycosyltransferase family 2 protein [Symploca sp. SIO2D2]